MEALHSKIHARGAYITPDAQATGVSIAIWFLATTFLIMYLSGQIVKYVMLRRLRVDDYILLLATILGFGLSMAYWSAASSGLGNMSHSDAQLDALSKAIYGADILYISSVCCVKLSLLIFIRQLTVDEAQRRIVLGLAVFTGLMTVASDFAVVFRCHVPQTWMVLSLQCFDQRAFWTAFGVLDMLTDASIIIAAAALVWTINIPFPQKAVVIACFSPRILVIVAAACRLAYLLDPPGPQDNLAFGWWISVVCAEVQVCFSISSACIPGVKPLFEAIEAGVWQVDEVGRRGLSVEDLYNKGYLRGSGSWLELNGNAGGGEQAVTLNASEKRKGTSSGSDMVARLPSGRP